jgi:hypothetical protein
VKQAAALVLVLDRSAVVVGSAGLRPRRSHAPDQLQGESVDFSHRVDEGMASTIRDTHLSLLVFEGESGQGGCIRLVTHGRRLMEPHRCPLRGGGEGGGEGAIP